MPKITLFTFLFLVLQEGIKLQGPDSNKCLDIHEHPFSHFLKLHVCHILLHIITAVITRAINNISTTNISHLPLNHHCISSNILIVITKQPKEDDNKKILFV